MAEYMCPRMPRGFCRGNTVSGTEPTVADLVKSTADACAWKVLEDSVTVQRRIEQCESCPKCTHPVCVTCRNVDKAVYSMFGGRRPPLALDAKSGVCSCDNTFVMGVASVKHEKALEGAPDSCWRNKT